MRPMLTYATIKRMIEIDADLEVPGSKSYTNRALIIAALADGKSILQNCLISEDIVLLVNALRKVGIDIVIQDTTLCVSGVNAKIGPAQGPLYLGNSGTGLRFMTGFVSLGHGSYIIDGNARMHERPIDDLLRSLKTLGVDYQYHNNEGYPPFTLTANGINGGKAQIDAKQSSQYLSSILMIAPFAKEDLEISVQSDLVSAPYVNMTLRIMKDFGVTVQQEAKMHYRVKTPQQYQAQTYSIEADASSASYFLAAAAITQGRVCIRNLQPESIQGDLQFVKILEKMGCVINLQQSGIEIIGKPLVGIDINMRNMPDMVPTLCVCALFAHGETIIRDIAHLKIKETDRLNNLAIELRKFGATIHTTESSIVIKPSNLNKDNILIETYQDHRMAMSFAIAGLMHPNLTIINPTCVEKSFPTYWDTLEKLGVQVNFSSQPS
ncbi:MAG: 3-phosphoshikimate 1-carboxyvinyltransferase [Chlamydiota bacterium]|nr:3-phosphoshikimate 1-carboxyvinyltransferase [Chlamydiota bacterium]